MTLARAAALAAILSGGGSAAWAGDDAPPPAPSPDPACARSEDVEAGPRLREWIALRQEKCAHLAPYEPTFVEGQVLAFEKAERPSLAELNLFGLYPRIQSIDHRSLYAGGVRLWHPDLSGSPVSLAGSAFWSLAGYQYFDVQLGSIPHHGRAFPLVAARTDDVFELPNVRYDDNKPFIAYGSFSYRWAPKFDYFGTGPDSLEEDRAAFRIKERLVEGVTGYRVARPLTLSARFGYDVASTGESDDDELPQVDDTFTAETAPGLGASPDFLRYGAAAVFDTRDVPRNPHRGAVLAAEFLRYDQRGGGDDASFNRLSGDARLFVSLGHPQRVLALRAYASQDSPTAGGRVPFYFLQYLGSSHTLRGFESQRFRGERLAVFQAEYRWEASPALELATFVDTGAVAATRDDALGDFRTDVGVGVRLKSHEATLLRFDFAWSSETFKFLFRFSPSY